MKKQIFCASLLQIKEIRDNYSLISCFGTNGLNDEILNAIKEWANTDAVPSPLKRVRERKEIIFCFDNDDAGKMAVAKCSNVLMEQCKNIRISSVELPNNNVNETLQLHDENIFTELLNNRKEVFLSTEKEDFEKVKVTEEKNLKSEISHLKSSVDFLSQKDLLKSLNQLIEKAGIIGEENSSLLLFLITISYLNRKLYRAHQEAERRALSQGLRT